MAGGFGAGAFGSMPFGSGAGVTIAFAEEVTRNSVRVRLAGPVRLRNRGNIGDALHDRGWRVEAFNDATAHVPIALWVVRESSDTAVVQFDSIFDGPAKRYRIVMSEAIAGAPGPVSQRSALFWTFGEVRVVRDQATRRSFDLANLQTGGSGPGPEQPLGTLALGADGDYLADAGLDNLKKRILRRLSTRRGAFAHLPDYGLVLPLKTAIKPALLREIQADATEQIRREIGVRDVSVGVSVPTPGVLTLSIRVTSDAGAFGVDVSVPLGV